MMTARPADLVSQSCKSTQAYQSILPHIKAIVKTREMKAVKEIICQIKTLIKDRKCTPKQKVFLLDLFHECIMQKVPEFLNYSQEKILERLGFLASKKTIELFRDSRSSQENMRNSEVFLNNLLNYIQIWAQDFGKGAGGLMTYYGTIYLQLKNKGMFHPSKSIVGFGSEAERLSGGSAGGETWQDLLGENPAVNETQRPLRREKSDKETLDDIDKLLEVLEGMDSPSENEEGKELIDNITSLKGKLDEILNRVLNKGDEIGIELTLNISERIRRLLEGQKPRESLYGTMPARPDPGTQGKVGYEIRNSSGVRDKASDLQGQMKDIDFNEQKKIERPNTQFISKPASNSSHPVEPAKQSFSIFDDILSLDIEPISNPPAKSLFNAQNIYPIISSPFTGPNGPVPVETHSNLPKFEQEIEKFKQTIKEKDDKIASLQSQLELMKLNFDQLQDSFSKTKNTLLLKEKECQESHFKKIVQNESQDSQIIDSVSSPLPLLNQSKDPASDNQGFFRYILCEEMGVLYDSVLFQVGYQIKFEGSTLKLICNIYNKSKSQLNDIRLEVNSDSFKTSIDSSSFASIPGSNQIFFSISASINNFSSTFPRLTVSCTLENSFYSVNLKLPINFCQFSSPFSSSHERLWQEWKDLLFASESSTVRFKDAGDCLPNLLKIGPNVLVLGSDVMKELASGEYLTIACVKELVFFMIRIKGRDSEVDVEVRCNDAGLRGSMMKLLVISLSD